MAKSARASKAVKSARTTLLWLLIILVALTGLNWAIVAFEDGRWTPQLALDLEGGTQVVLEAQLPAGASPSDAQLNQAVSIIRQRVDASGVSEAEITKQGGRNVVVSVPGEMDAETRARIESSAMLEFRPVLVAEQYSAEMQAQYTPELLEEFFGLEPGQLPESTMASEPTDASDPAWVTDKLAYDFYLSDCQTLSERTEPADPTQPLITCDEAQTEKFILGPVEIDGSRIKDASAGQVVTSQGVNTGQWAVNLEFDDEGKALFQDITQRLTTINLEGTGDARGRFAITMDEQVILAPTSSVVITDGRAQITGTFTEEDARAFADQLKFGALPFSFETKSTQTISATLGTWQLQVGVIAGAIGLVLVAVYSLFQYRVLGLVTIASLGLLGTLAYLVVTFMSNQEGYRLSLAGVAGLIVAIGITADSFIVYFERIKDELRDGKTLVNAVDQGWSRAIRTILASDAVNLLVAIVLIFVAVGNVRGFAITLAVTTVIDLVVVTMFTHPLMRLLATTRFFGEGHPASGLDPNALGALYRGRGQVRTPAPAKAASSKPKKSTKNTGSEAEPSAPRQSLAERKAALAASKESDES